MIDEVKAKNTRQVMVFEKELADFQLEFKQYMYGFKTPMGRVRVVPVLMLEVEVYDRELESVIAQLIRDFGDRAKYLTVPVTILNEKK